MSVSIEKQIEFYDWQLREMDLSWKKYHSSNVKDLYSSKELYLGRIWGFDEAKGVLIIRFKKGKFPRLKVPLTLSYPKASIGAFSNWVYTYAQYRNEHTAQYSECNPSFFLKNEMHDEYRYIGFKNVSMDFLHHIKADLANKKHPIVVLGMQDPPRDYLVALKDFTKNNPTNHILNLSAGNIDSWRPVSLTNVNTIESDTVKIIDQNKHTVIQGPPGTGKTFLIAQLCEHYLNQDKRVCITALTHKALIEAALKDGLKEKCKDKKVFKTNLSGDEQAQIPELQQHEAKKPIQKGQLLLSTYYSLSGLLNEEISHKRFDLIVIEEASQTFLTTIAGFSSLASRVLIVGDFMQLQPIVLEERKKATIDREINTLVNGLRTYSANNAQSSYRLINSYRLTQRAAEQTGVFYYNSLRSLSDVSGLSLEGSTSEWFCPEGGGTLIHFENMDEGKIPRNAIQTIVDFVKAMNKQHPDKKVAVLSAFKVTVESIIDTMLATNVSFNNLEVNTVDRIQGMTVDICIYLIPSSNIKFSYSENRFNVATSRARNGTIIIAEDIISNQVLLSNVVQSYLNKLRKIVF